MSPRSGRGRWFESIPQPRVNSGNYLLCEVRSRSSSQLSGGGLRTVLQFLSLLMVALLSPDLLRCYRLHRRTKMTPNQHYTLESFTVFWGIGAYASTSRKKKNEYDQGNENLVELKMKNDPHLRSHHTPCWLLHARDCQI